MGLTANILKHFRKSLAIFVALAYQQETKIAEGKKKPRGDLQQRSSSLWHSSKRGDGGAAR
jgi:hypothetical protein